jgi:hypothetical protein
MFMGEDFCENGSNLEYVKKKDMKRKMFRQWVAWVSRDLLSINIYTVLINCLHKI